MPWTGAPDGGFGSDRPWLPLDLGHRRFNVEAQEADEHSVLHWTRRVIALRHENEALRTGSIRLLDTSSEQVVAFERKAGGDALRCVFNLSRETAGNPAPGGTVLLACGGAYPAADTLPPSSGYIARC